MKHLQRILKSILITFVFLFSTTNCYFNPLVNGLLNPKLEESDLSALLGLAGGSGNLGVTVNITGQIKRLGVALEGVEIKLANSSFSTKNQTNSSITNAAGRFYLSIPTGSPTLQFSDAGTIVNVQLGITPFSATVISSDNLGYQIQSLDVFFIGVEPPVYLELVSSVPYEGLLIDDGNYSSLIAGSFKFKFSEDLEYPSNPPLWLAENFITYPPMTFESPSISKNDVTIMLSSSLSPFTPYIITLNSGIKTATGKSVRPTTIQFVVGALGL